MKIALGSDEKHPLTDALVAELRARGHETMLFGPLAEGDAEVDWPQTSAKVALAVAAGRADQGIVCCWTGTGASIAANKVRGIRAALCHDAETAKGARTWNHANVLALSLRATSIPVAREILDAWFSTPLSDDEWNRRQIDRVAALDAGGGVRREDPVDFGPHATWTRPDGEFVVSDDPSRLDLDVIHGYLTRSYWSPGVARETVERSIARSLCFGVYARSGEQVGFARLVTDCVTFAYLADVFVSEPFRGRGLSKWLMEVIQGHPRLQGLRRWLLVTRDAQGLYAQTGFTPLANPERHMEKMRPSG